MAGQPLGDLGPSEGRPTIVAWKWYYHAGGAPLWLLIAVLLVAIKENRCRQAWLIFLPLAALAIVCRMAARLLRLPDDAAEWFGIAVMSCATAWAAVWLCGVRLAGWPKVVRFVLAWTLMAAIGLLSCLSHLGLDNSQDLLSVSATHAIFSVVVLLGMALSGRSCRRGFRRGRFMGSLFLWMVVATVVSLLLLVGIVVSLNETGGFFVVVALLQVAIGSFFIAAALYLLNLPFMLLAFNAPFYGARFHAMFCPETPLSDELTGPDPARYAPPLSTEPTRKPVSVADVAGPWEFYFDEASSTVVVDFKPDGTFAQTVMPNRGGVQQCRGGAWRLEGPLVHLTGYVTAKEGIPLTKTWWMVDTSQGLALFGGETTFFCMLRGRYGSAGE